MRFSTTQPPFSCGIDLHARSMSVCIVRHEGEMLVPRHMQAAPDPLLNAVAPYREGPVIAVACLFTWEWLADLCVHDGSPCVRGPALYRRAIHGGTAKNDTSDAQQIAALLRGGRLPHASVSPAEMRATRALLRRRMPLMRKRADLLAPVQNTKSPYHLLEIGKTIAYNANREGVAARFDDAAVQKNSEVDLALSTDYDERLRALALASLRTAKPQDANPLSLLQTGPGIGKMLRLVLRYAIQDMDRFPRVQDCASSCRLVKGAKESASKRVGTSGQNIGNAHLQEAFSDAAALFLRNNPQGQQYLAC